jgi:hypothetical protein
MVKRGPVLIGNIEGRSRLSVGLPNSRADKDIEFPRRPIGMDGLLRAESKGDRFGPGAYEIGGSAPPVDISAFEEHAPMIDAALLPYGVFIPGHL